MSDNAVSFGSKKIAASMAALFGLNGGTQFIAAGMLAIFLGSHAFINNTQVGLIVALASLVTAVAQPLWGVVADHSASKNRILFIIHICLACAAWLFILPKHTGFLTLLPAVIIIYSLVYSPMSLTDTIVVENLDKVRLRYGVMRALSAGGAATAAFMMFAFSSVVDANPQYAYVLVFCATLLCVVPLRFIPRTVGHAHRQKLSPADTGSKRSGFDIAAIFQNKKLLLLLTYGLFTFIWLGCQNTYFSMYFATERGLNAGVGMYGLLFTACIGAEGIVMLLGTRVYNKPHIYTVLTLVHIAAVIRSLIIYFSPNEFAVFSMIIFHGHLYGMLFLRVAPYIGSIVPEEMRATGQACWAVMFMGLGPVIGSAVGGLIANFFEIRQIFLIASFALAITTMVFYVIFRRQRALERPAM